MADFAGCISSTGFHVRDEHAWLEEPAVKLAKRMDGFFSKNNEHDNAWSFGWYDQYPSPVLTEQNADYDPDNDADEKGEFTDHDILDAVMRHIVPGEVCRVQVSGNEKLRYIGGMIAFVTSKGIAGFPGETCWEERLTHDNLRRMAEEFTAAVNAIIE